MHWPMEKPLIHKKCNLVNKLGVFSLAVYVLVLSETLLIPITNSGRFSDLFYLQVPESERNCKLLLIIR